MSFGNLLMHAAHDVATGTQQMFILKERTRLTYRGRQRLQMQCYPGSEMILHGFECSLGFVTVGDECDNSCEIANIPSFEMKDTTTIVC